MSLAWVSADLRTGAVLADLTSLLPDWPLRRTICTYDTAVAHLHLEGAPTDWERATKPGAATLFCYDDDDATRAIIWAGFVTRRPRPFTPGIVDLSLVTLEGYLDRRYVPDSQYDDGAYVVIEDLISSYIADGDEPGIAGITVARTEDGPTVDFTADSGTQWQNTDNATVLARVTQVIGQYGGEFTVEWEWTDGGRAIVPTVMVADRIGTRAGTGLAPAVTFDLPGSITDGSFDEDYSAGAGANKIVYYSTGSGSVTPYADPVVAADFEDRPTFEYRDQPAPNATVAQLTRYATKALPILAPGAQSVSLTVQQAQAMTPAEFNVPDPHQRVGVDWRLGDDIGYVLGGTNPAGVSVPSFPEPVTGVGRAVAYEIGESTVTPILADKQVYKEDDA